MTLFRRHFSVVGGTGPLLVTVLCYLVPLAVWGWSLRNEKPGEPVLPMYQSQIGDTAVISMESAALAATMGAAVACLARFSSRRTANILTFAMMVPLLTGFVARNYSWVGLLTYVGTWPPPLSQIGGLLDSRGGVIVVMGVVFVPFAYFIVSQASTHLSPQLYEASRTLGASDTRAFFVLTLPLLLPAVILAFALSSILGFGYFVTPQLIGGGNFPFLGNGVLSRLDLGDRPGAALLGVCLLVTVFASAGIVAVVATWWRARHSSPKNMPPPPPPLAPEYARTE